ncbi:MAG: hypothetical protein ABL965_13525 [Nitrospira sp.]
MPYVQRDFSGKIIGLYTNPQPQADGTCLTELDPLPDDNPEVIAFREQHPVPASLLTPPSREEIKALHREHEYNERELRELDAAILIHMKVWSELETALSALFYETLHPEPRSSRIPYVIYYSPDGFDARQKVVDKVLRQFFQENPQSAVIEPHWEVITKEIDRSRKMRNNIAHGAPLTLNIRGKNYVRHSPPAFDINRVGSLIPKGTIPGVSAEEISHANKSIIKLVECIDATNRAIAAFHQNGPNTLQQTLPPLENNLRAFTCNQR